MKNPLDRWIAGGAILSFGGLGIAIPLKLIGTFSGWWIGLMAGVGSFLLYLTCCIVGSRGENEDDLIITIGTPRQRTVVFLFVCSANVARSATAEHLARAGRCISDSVGSDPNVAVRRLTVETIARARRIVCMEEEHAEAVLRLAPQRAMDIIVWNVPDNYHYCQPELIAEITPRLQPLIEQWHNQRFLFLGPHGEEVEDQ